MRKRHSDAGFTLVEVMATVACVLVLGAMAVPRLQGYVLQSRLEAAKPYLMEIAAKQRMHRIENGVYCCTAYTTLSETVLSSSLGVSLADSGDFCFAFICRDATLCARTSGPGFIAPPATGETPEFEVWAILRADTATTTGPGSASCTAATGKARPTGWAFADTATRAGRVGQAVALRYPPPANGLSASNFDWRDGFSLSGAMQP